MATNADPATDQAVIAELRALAIQRVRLDYTYGDADNPVARFLDALLAEGFSVILHVLQPFDAASRMPDPAAGEEWRRFLVETLDRYGERIEMVEVCSTLNRKRWAGYTLQGFLAAWDVAYREVRQHGVVLAGPSITDFEPPWTAGILALLAERGQLPDIHTDNLFAERATEPERWDQKILGPRLAGALRFNLIKKARLLARLGQDAGVPRLVSPAAFWTLPRIERMLPDSEQKQADYLARYLVLCAASGALERAYWGPLVCHREGLIDDGPRAYPKLERITHYAQIDGQPADFRRRPAALSLAAFNRLIPGTTYLGKQNAMPAGKRLAWPNAALEVHAFASDTHNIHIVWTTNSHAAAACDLYREADLAAAEWLDRDGLPLDEAPTLFSEAPVYLRWPVAHPVVVLPEADLLSGVRIHRHHPGLRHYYHRDEHWHGMVLAANRSEADRLIQSLHPTRLVTPERRSEQALRHARNAIWTIADPRQPGARLVVKQPVKHHLHKKLLDRLKPSKARRSWNGAAELLRRGLGTAAPVAWFEQRSGVDITRNWYVCEYVVGAPSMPGGLSVGALFGAFAKGQAHPSGITAEVLFPALAAFLQRLHGRGIHFRDLSGGNILVIPQADGQLDFALIDTARLHVLTKGLPLRKRLEDLTRACHKLDPVSREAFMRCYLGPLGQQFTPAMRLRFWLYDRKAALKRRLRATAFYKRLKR